MGLGHIDLNLLVALDALLTERHVSRAGDRIDLSQPAMSSALRRLRALFGDELLVRSGREYRLTPLAEGLVEPVREILRLVEHTVDYRPAFDPATDRRTFRIAASDVAEFMMVQPLLERIARDAPGISLDLRALEGKLTIDMIERGDLDLGIWPLGIFDSNLCEEALYEDQLVFVAWRGCEEIGERLNHEQLETLPQAIRSWSWYDRTGLRQPHYCVVEDGSVRVSSEHNVIRLFLLRGTNTITTASRRLATRLADAADLRIVDAAIDMGPVVEGHYWHNRNTSDPAHRWLREQLRAIGAQIEAEGAERAPADQSQAPSQPQAEPAGPSIMVSSERRSSVTV